LQHGVAEFIDSAPKEKPSVARVQAQRKVFYMMISYSNKLNAERCKTGF
jgi:hypothetical protein